MLNENHLRPQTYETTGNLILSGQPCLDIDAERVDFGAVPQGGAVSHVIMLANVGRVELHLSSITTPAPPFHLQGFALPLTLDAGKKLALPVSITAEALGAFADSFRITSNDPVSPDIVVELKAAVVSPEVRVSTGALNEQPAAAAASAMVKQPQRAIGALTNGKAAVKQARPTTGSLKRLPVKIDTTRAEPNKPGKDKFMLMVLALALVVGGWHKFKPATNAAPSSAETQVETVSGSAGRPEAPRPQYTVEELQLPQEITPPPILPAPPRNADVPVDKSYADLPDDNVSEEALDELPQAQQQEIIDRRNKIRVAREARARQLAASPEQPPLEK